MKPPGLPKALVLAAGMGRRLREISGDLPKPLTPFVGAPILAHNLRWLAGAGVSEVFINLHYQADLIRSAIGDGSAFGLAIHYVFEPDLLGTAGALANIAPHVDRAMLVAYGDNLSRFDLGALAYDHTRAGADATVALFDAGAHVHTGIAGGRVSLGADGAITGFIEGGGSGGPGLVNTGVYVVEPSLLDLIAPGRLVDFGRDVFPAALAQGRRLQGRVIETGGYCLGLDTPEAYRCGVELVRDGVVQLSP